MMTVREMKAFLMEAAQDLTVRHRVVYDVQGRALAKIEPQHKCCANCRYCHRVEMWGVKRMVCGDPLQVTSVDVEPDGWCKFHESADIDLGLTMDIWY